MQHLLLSCEVEKQTNKQKTALLRRVQAVHFRQVDNGLYRGDTETTNHQEGIQKPFQDYLEKRIPSSSTRKIEGYSGAVEIPLIK